MLIDSGIVAALQSLGVDVSNFTPATDFTFIDADAGLLYQFPLAAELNPRGHSSVWSLFPRRTPCADVLISELEQVLLGVIEDEPDIEILQGVEIKSIQSAGKQQVLFTHQDSECCLSAEVIAVCDGARTATPRLGLGVNWAIRDAIRFGKLLPVFDHSIGQLPVGLPGPTDSGPGLPAKCCCSRAGSQACRQSQRPGQRARQMALPGEWSLSQA